MTQITGGNLAGKIDTAPSMHVPRISAELIAVCGATILLFIVSALLAPGTLRGSSLIAMLPFVAMLMIVGVGQTLVI